MTFVAYDIEPSETLKTQKLVLVQPALELHSRAVPNVVVHHRVNRPDTERISGERQIKKIRIQIKWSKVRKPVYKIPGI